MTNKFCAVAFAHRLLPVAAALLSVALGAALPVSAESVSAREKPLYVGDFGPRYVFSHGEFLMPNDSRVQWTIRSLQNPGADSSTSQSIGRYGVRSYRSFSQLMKPPRTLHLPSDYSPAVSLPCFSYNTGSERASAGDFWPRGDSYTSVIRPGASNLFQPVSAMKFPSRNFDVKHNFHLSKYPAAAQRFDLNSNIGKRESASSSSH